MKQSNILFPLILVLLMQFVPAVKNFHVEATLLFSVGCFVFGLSHGFGRVGSVVRFLFIAGFALAVIDYSRGCFSIEGVYLWLLHPISSFVFGSSIHSLIDSFNIKLTFGMVFAVSLLIIFIEVTVPLLILPHVYIFGHSFGFWPGPVYDRTVLVDGLHLVFRFSTFSLSLFLFLWAKSRLYGKRFPWISLLIFILSFLFSIHSGVYRTEKSIANTLGNSSQYENIRLFYDKSVFDSIDADSLAKHAFDLMVDIEKAFGLSSDSRKTIHVFVYNHAWQKKELTGAKFTSYVPVWQSQDQLHITKQALESTLKHELVHVVAKRFGNWFGGSYNAALIEGIAVAVAPDSSAQYNNALVRAYDLHHKLDINRLFSITGFYSSRGSQSYSAAGSFVHYVLESQGADLVKDWYSNGLYPTDSPDINTLVLEWQTYLDAQEVDSSLIPTSERVYSRRSPIELDCPHVLTQLQQDVDSAFYFMAETDSVAAKQIIERYQNDSTLHSRMKEAILGE